MDKDMGGVRCLAGFVLLVLAHFTGSFCWIARLLGYMGIANGTSEHLENRWMGWAHQLSTLAVVLFAVLEILRLTGLFILPDMGAVLLECVLTFTCGVCVFMGIQTRKQGG